MRKYIVLSYTFAGMGGGQMYQRNKLLFMKKHGYNISGIASQGGTVIVPELKLYEKNVIEELSVLPYIQNIKTIESVLCRMKDMIGDIDQNSIIESNSKVTALWAELFAKKYNIKHIIYIIDEKVGSLDTGIKSFLLYKKERNELRGIKKETYEMIFDESYDESTYKYCLNFYGNNVVEDFDSPLIHQMPCGDIYLATIGRLDKAYVKTLVEQIVEFASRHIEKKIVYLMIGDSPNKKDVDIVHDIIKEANNIHFVHPGAMFPIPEKLLSKFDVFVSSAGSARVSANVGIPTITIDARDFGAIGVFGYDTENTVFRNDEPVVSIADKLDWILQNNRYKELKRERLENQQADENTLFGPHLDWISNILEKEKIYYDIMGVELPIQRRIEKYIYRVLGMKCYQKIRSYVFNKL